MSAADPLSAWIGRKLREIRQERGWRLEDVAQRATLWAGLDWTGNVVATIEGGYRTVTLAEFLMLPDVYDLRLPELFPPDDGVPVVHVPAGPPPYDGLNPGGGTTTFQSGSDLRQKLAGTYGTGSPAIVGQRASHVIEATREAERKAARRLGRTPDEVVAGAHALWGRGLTDERDARLAERVDEHATARTRQAARGHVTRELLAELAASPGALPRPPAG